MKVEGNYLQYSSKKEKDDENPTSEAPQPLHHTDPKYQAECHRRRIETRDRTFGALFDETDPDCLMQRLPLEMVEHVKNAVAAHPTYFMQVEKDLVKICDADRLDYTLRIRFWDEYSRVILYPDVRMSWTKFLAHVIGKKQFLNYYCPITTKLIFVLYPPKNYQTTLEMILEQGMERILEALKLPICDPDGKFDKAAFKEIMDAAKWAAVNLKGMPVQRLQIQQHTVTTNVSALEGQKRAEVERLSSMSLEELEKMKLALEVVERSTPRITDGVVIDAVPQITDQDTHRDSQ